MDRDNVDLPLPKKQEPRRPKEMRFTITDDRVYRFKDPKTGLIFEAMRVKQPNGERGFLVDPLIETPPDQWIPVVVRRS